MHFYILGHDNRGTDTCIFGRIYLGTRKKGEVVGSIGYGRHRDDPDPYAIWPTHDDPHLGRDPMLRERAQEFLKQLYPNAK